MHTDSKLYYSFSLPLSLSHALFLSLSLSHTLAHVHGIRLTFAHLGTRCYERLDVGQERKDTHHTHAFQTRSHCHNTVRVQLRPTVTVKPLREEHPITITLVLARTRLLASRTAIAGGTRRFLFFSFFFLHARNQRVEHAAARLASVPREYTYVRYTWDAVYSTLRSTVR